MMRNLYKNLTWISLLTALSLSLTACSGGGKKEDTETATKSVTETQGMQESGTEAGAKAETEVMTEAAAETVPETETEVLTEADKEAVPETETEVMTEAATEAVPETETEVLTEAAAKAVPETETEVLFETETETEAYVSGLSDYWYLPEVKSDKVPGNIIEASLGGNNALFTYLSSNLLNYDYKSDDYSTGYGFLDNPADLFGYRAFGTVGYSKNDPSMDYFRMNFLIFPQDDEELEHIKKDLDDYLGKQSSYETQRMFAAVSYGEDDDETKNVYSAHEYIINDGACYLIEGYKDDSAFYNFNHYGFSAGSRMDDARYNGSCQRCIALISKNDLSELSEYSDVYDFERYVRYQDAYSDLEQQQYDAGLDVWMYYRSDLDEFWDGTDYEAWDSYLLDSLEEQIRNAEDVKELSKLTGRLDNDTQDLIRLAGRYEQLDGYKQSYNYLLRIAGLLVFRGEKEAALDIVSVLEDSWKKDDKTYRTAAFGDSESYPLTHDTGFLESLRRVLEDDMEYKYLNTLQRVCHCAPYLFGERDIVYGSKQYEKEYQPLIDSLTELDGYSNSQLYIQKLLKPFLLQAIDKRNTDDAEQILTLMEEHFPDCGEDVISVSETEDWHHQIDKIVEEEAYKADKRKELKEAKAGDTVTFGKWNEKDLDWIILEKKDKTVILLQKDGIWQSDYDIQRGRKSLFAASDIRTMLEGEIYPDAFDSAQKQMIKETLMALPDGASIDDHRIHFHLLSGSKVLEYLPDAEDRVLYDPEGNPCEWWLISPGSRDDFVRYIDKDGSVREGGAPSVKTLAVRPMIYLTMNDASE